MTSIETDYMLRRFFTPDHRGLIPAFYQRRKLVEALIDYYLTHEVAASTAGGKHD